MSTLFIRFFVVAFFIGGFTAFATPLQAQINTTSLQQEATLETQPRYPSPNQTVSVTLNDYAFSTNGATIDWYVDNKLIPQAVNQRKINLVTKAAGEETTVRSVSTLPSGQIIEASTTIIPVKLDLLIEANTLTPSFYPGRAIPTAGSQVRVTAVPFLSNTTNPQDYSYLWEVGEDVVDGGSIRGKNYAIFRSEFQRSVPVKVTVFNNSGTLLTSRTINVPISEPELYFYEINPLRGLLPIALNKEHILAGNELQVRAEPFFYDPTSLQENYLAEWSLNGLTVDNQNTDPFEITLGRQGGTGTFKLGFHVRNLSQLLQGVEDEVTIQF